MCVECVCGYVQVRYRNVEGDWRVGDVCMVNVPVGCGSQPAGRSRRVRKLYEEGGTYYLTEVVVSRSNEVVTNRKFDPT